MRYLLRMGGTSGVMLTSNLYDISHLNPKRNKKKRRKMERETYCMMTVCGSFVISNIFVTILTFFPNLPNCLRFSKPSS